MKKKLIFTVTIVFFAVATLFNLNLRQSNNAGDVSLDEIAIMAQAGTEFIVGGRVWTTERQWYNGIPFTSRWTPRLNELTGTVASFNTTRQRNIELGLSATIPKTPIEIGPSISANNKNNQSITFEEPAKFAEVVCINGDGNCINGMDPTWR